MTRFFLVLCLAVVAFAAAPASKAAPKAASAADNPVVNWDAEPGLDAPMTLEAASLHVSEFAGAVAAQTKVKLEFPPALAARALTIRLRAMPLRVLLPSLGQLYGLEWTRGAAPGTYRARVCATPLELRWLQMGDEGELRERVRLGAQFSENAAIAALAAGWKTSELEAGVSFSALPAPLRDALQAGKQRRSALQFLGDWGQWTPFQLRAMRVRVALPRAGADLMPSAPQLVLVDPMGAPRRALGALEIP